MIASVFAFFLLCAAPGPAVISITSAAMSAGRGPALSHSLGLTISLAAWGVLAAAGFGSLLTASAPVIFVLKFGGAGVLLWMTYAAATSALTAHAPPPDYDAPPPNSAWFWRGVLLNGLNPKVLIAWGAVFVIGAAPERIWITWALCCFACLAVYAAYSGLFSRAVFRRAYAQIRQGAEAVAAAVFGAGALSLLTWTPETR